MGSKLKIYIIHYKGYPDRKKHMNNLLKDIKYESEFIDDFDREELTQKDIDSIYKDSESAFLEKVQLWGSRANPYAKLRKSEISVAIKFIHTFRKILIDSHEFALILEDDCIPLRKEFIVEIEKLIKKNSKWDVMFVGEGMGESFRNGKIGFRKYIPFIKSIKISHPASNTTDAIIIKKDSVAKLMENLIPINLVHDWELAYQFYIQDMEIHWSKKSIFKQGSKNNVFHSEMREES